VVVYGGDDNDVLIRRIVDDNMVGAIKLTPSHLYLLSDKKMKSSNIRRFILGGEQLETQIARNMYENFQGAVEIYNEYGPTEATVGCMIHQFAIQKDTAQSVPIGKPIANTSIYILNKHMQPVPLGAAGELYISGQGLARGYLNRPELTAEKFLGTKRENKNSRHASFPEGQRFYRTGDLARWLSDCTIEFLGRMDLQVKIRGFRVELGEIEIRLVNHPEIKEAAVIAMEITAAWDFADITEFHTGWTDVSICAYLVTHNPLDSYQLREYLSQTLPEYMIPSYFVFLETMPLTPAGKIDKKALPAPEVKSQGAYVAPRSEIEKKLVEIWAQTLGGKEPDIGIDDNYFELGGHSLKATLLVSHIHKELNVKVSLSKVFELPTVRTLAKFVRNAAESRFISLKDLEQKVYY
jgi:tyrocidine synthetase-3